MQYLYCSDLYYVFGCLVLNWMHICVEFNSKLNNAEKKYRNWNLEKWDLRATKRHLMSPVDYSVHPCPCLIGDYIQTDYEFSIFQRNQNEK